MELGTENIGDGECVLLNEADDSMGRIYSVSLGERLAACYNACAGLNPEAVPEMVKALDDLIKASWEAIIPEDPAAGRALAMAQAQAQAALAKLKEGQQ